MTDQEKREKVIALLERYADFPNLAGVENYGDKIVDTPASLIVDTIALLKAQKPIPVPISIELHGRKVGQCPNCGKAINSGDYPNYCGRCGQAVKWDG